MTPVLVITPGNAPETRELEASSTVGTLLNTLVEEGKIADPDEVKILDDRAQGMSPDEPIGDIRAINFIVRLAGA